MAKKKPGPKKKTQKDSNASQSRKGPLPPPFPLAMVVCDNIHRDPGTGKLFLLGTFSVIGTQSLPTIHPLLGLYVELTNGRGKVKFKVQLVDADEEREPIWKAEDEMEFEDPRMVATLAFIIPGLRFEHAGEYRFQLFASDEFLMERRILLITNNQS